MIDFVDKFGEVICDRRDKKLIGDRPKFLRLALINYNISLELSI